LLWDEFKQNLRNIDPTDAEDAELVKSIIDQEHPDREFEEALKKGLEELTYISSKEAQLIMYRYAIEVQQLLETDPARIVIFDTDLYGDSSESYFAEIVRDMIDPKFQDRVKFYWDGNNFKNPFKNQPIITYYRFDDSANSGSQVATMSKLVVKRYTQQVDIRIRLIACSRVDMQDKIKDRIASFLEEEGIANRKYTVDVQYKFPNKMIEMKYKGKVISWGTSIVFSHKIQDNLPEFFISLSEKHRRGQPHLLRYDEYIIPPYRKPRLTKT
jgi:hypothetical protein